MSKLLRRTIPGCPGSSALQFLESPVPDSYRDPRYYACNGRFAMTRITAISRPALPSRVWLALLWLAIALTVASAAHAEEHAVSDSLHRSAANAQEHAQHLGNRLQTTAHHVIDVTGRGLHRAFDATAQALEHAADKARGAFHNI